MTQVNVERRRRLPAHVAAVLIFLVVLAGALPPAGTAQAPTAIAEVVSVDGRVEVSRRRAVGWERIVAGSLLYEGDVVRTASDSSADIVYPGLATVHLEAGTRVQIISGLNLQRDGVEPATLSMQVGELWVYVVSALSRIVRFRVETPSIVAGVRGTLFRLAVESDGTTLLAVDEGVVEASESGSPRSTAEGVPADASSMVRAGRAVVVSPGGAVPTPVGAEIVATFDATPRAARWERWRSRAVPISNEEADDAPADMEPVVAPAAADAPDSSEDEPPQPSPPKVAASPDRRSGATGRPPHAGPPGNDRGPGRPPHAGPPGNDRDHGPPPHAGPPALRGPDWEPPGHGRAHARDRSDETDGALHRRDPKERNETDHGQAADDEQE